MLSQLRHLNITGPVLKWDCVDRLQQQYYPSLAALVGDYSEQVMVAQVSYGSEPMCELPKGGLIGHSTFQPLKNSRDQCIYSELQEDNNIHSLRILAVCPIRSQFCQYSLCNVYHLWQPDELHQLLLGSVQDLSHCLLKYLEDRIVNDQSDNLFTLVPRYPSL